MTREEATSRALDALRDRLDDTQRLVHRVAESWTEAGDALLADVRADIAAIKELTAGEEAPGSGRLLG